MHKQIRTKLNLLLLHEAQRINCFQQRVHNDWSLATEVVELHCHFLDEVLQLEGVIFSVLLALQHVDLELAGLFDPVNSVVLPFRLVVGNLGVDRPFDTEAEHSDKKDKDEEPDEPVEDGCELEEETVDEDRLAVISHLSIHEYHLNGQACHAKTIQYVGVQTSVRSQRQNMRGKHDDHHHVCRRLGLLEFLR